MNLGGIGGFLVIKLVKPIKIVCSWTPHYSGVGDFRLSKTEQKLEQKLADLARQEALANCNCRERIFVNSTKVFEAEMSKTCPVHGFRRFGRIYVVQIVDTSPRRTRKIDEKSIGLDELVQEYERRLAEVEQVEDEQEYD